MKINEKSMKIGSRDRPESEKVTRERSKLKESSWSPQKAQKRRTISKFFAQNGAQNGPQIAKNLFKIDVRFSVAFRTPFFSDFLRFLTVLGAKMRAKTPEF